MIKGLLNPKKILGSSIKTPSIFQKFMLGKVESTTTLPMNSAVNNIVRYKSTNIKSDKLDNLSIINNISTNILNSVGGALSNYISTTGVNIDNAFSLVQKRLSEIESQVEVKTDNVLKKIELDYRDKLVELENRTPKRILEGFLKVHENAIGFINFFGDRKNISKIGDKLKRLKTIFNDSFEIAKIIRQIINKIVKQLTNLPPQSTQMSGLNLGQSLRKGSGPRMGNVLGNSGKLALGALGIAGVGMGTSALASSVTPAKEYQQKKLEESKSTRVEPRTTFDEVAGIFTKAVNKFTAIIMDAFIRPREKSPSNTSGTSSSINPPSNNPPGSQSLPPGGLAPPGGDGTAGVEDTRLSGVFSKYPEISALLRTIQFAEGTAIGGKDPYYTMFGGGQFQDLSIHPDKVIHGDEYSSAAAGAYQFLPKTWRAVSSKRGLPDFSKSSQDIAAVEKIMERLNIKSYDELNSLLKIRGLSKVISERLAPEWASFPTSTGESYYGQPVKPLNKLQDVYNKALELHRTETGNGMNMKPTQPSQTTQPLRLSTSPSPRIQPASRNRTNKANNLSQAISQIFQGPLPDAPDVSKRAPEVTSTSQTNVIDATSSSPSSGINVPSMVGSSPSPSVALLSSSNPDNFYIHLSSLRLNLANS